MAIFPHAQNWAHQMIFHDCARPWFIWVTTFVPAFVELLITISILDMNDIIREAAKGKAFQPVGRPGRGGKHFRKPIIQNLSPGTEFRAQKALQTLLIVTEPLEKIGFAWLLYSATDQFFYNWQTALKNSAYCEDGRGGPLHRSRGSGGNVPMLPGGGATPLPTLQQNRGGWANNAFGCSLPIGQYQFVFAANVVAPGSGTPAAGAQLRFTGNVGPAIVQSGTSALAPNAAASHMISSQQFFPLGGSVGWELYGNAIPTGIRCEGARAIAMAMS